MLSLRYRSTKVDYRTWLHVPSGTPWSTSSDTYQNVEIYKNTSKFSFPNFFLQSFVIELKFCRWIGVDLTQIKFQFVLVWLTFTGVVVLC